MSEENRINTGFFSETVSETISCFGNVFGNGSEISIKKTFYIWTICTTLPLKILQKN